MKTMGLLEWALRCRRMAKRYVAASTMMIMSSFGHATPGEAGTIDGTFGTIGVISNAMTFNSSRASAVAYNFNYRRILLAGSCFSGSSTFDDFCLARYRDNGAVDTSFGGGTGIVVTDVGGGYDNATAVYFESDVYAIVAGACANGATADFCAVRYNFNGTLDATFGAGGKVLVPVGSENDYANAIVKQNDGKFVLAGWCTNGSINQMCLLRLNANGSVDTTFGNNGRVVENIFQGATDRRATALAMDGSRIIVTGTCKSGTVHSMCAIRYNSNGTRDLTFAGGALIFQIGSDSKAAAVNVGLFTGSIFISGTCIASPAPVDGRADFCAAKFNSSGALDTSYGDNGDGKVITSSGLDTIATSASLDYVDKLVVAGSCSTPKKFCAVRYNAFGELDSSFGASGFFYTSVLSFANVDKANASAIQPDGKLLLAGECDVAGTLQFCATRYDVECTLDPNRWGQFRADIEGRFLLRSMLGFNGLALADGINFGGYSVDYRNYCAAAAAPLCNGDIDGDGKQTATVDGLIAIRAMLGLTGNAVTNGINFPANATRTSWVGGIRNHLANQCGMTLPPLIN
jgi:uncharacterized delta-60 repeat protein